MNEAFFNDYSTTQLQASAISTGKPMRVRFLPAYSGGIMRTDGIGIPESTLINGEEYPEGARLAAVIDLSTVQLEDNIPIQYAHDSMHHLGHTESVTTDGKTISIVGYFSSPSEWVREVVESAKMGARWQCSVGSGPIDPTQKQLVRAGESLEVNGQRLFGPFTLLKNLRIIEISLVPAGADPGTEVLLGSAVGTTDGGFLRETIAKEFKMNFESWCSEKGFTLESLDEANRAALEALYKAETDAAANETVEASGEETPPEEKKEEVQASAECPEEEEVKASGEETPPEEKKEEEAVKASALGMKRAKGLISSLNTPAASASRNTAEAPMRSDVLQASALLSVGIEGEWLVKHGYSRRCVDTADRESGDVSLLSLMGEVLQASGMTPNYRNPRGIVEAYREVLKASAVSTKNFGNVNIFSPILDKQMRYKYERAESIWTQLFRKRTVRNFDEVATVDFDVLGRAKDLAENEDYPEILLKSSGEKYAVSKQGVVAGISFESQISDDMGALDRIGDELVNMIRDVQTDKFWTLFWANKSTIFTGANAITKKLTVAGLAAASKALKSKKNANGRFINVPGAILLVPTSLEDIASNLFTLKFGDSTQIENPAMGKYKPISDPYLGTDGGYAGATDTGWFMIADPTRYPLGEFAVMNGYEAPRIKEQWYDHKDALNLRALGTIGFKQYTTNVPAVYSSGTVD